MPPTRTDHKAGKAHRQAIAEETCAILARGWYDVGGERIAIADEIAQCAVNTVFHPATSSHHASLGASTSSAPTQIEVQNVGTMAAARALAEAGHNVAALNFASAKNPGGGFRKGAQAQEECLARCSALYSSLTSPAAAGFYAAVHKGGDGLYTDGLIYSPAVAVLRDDAEALARPWRCAFVTAAAPNAGIARDRGASAERLRAVLVERADRVLGAAVAHGHDAIVLGAWGCGVFKNEPRDVARAFATLLAGKYRDRFARVVFAILGGGEANLAVFRETFGGAPVAPAAAPTPEAPTPRPGAYFLVMDFEATCEKDARNWVHEIIEFPAVLVDAATLAKVDEFRALVRPTERPTLTRFCTELTSITQADVDGADALPEVLGRFEAWCATHGLRDAPAAALPVTCGDWDLEKMLPVECRRKGLAVPAVLRSWCNVKRPFAAQTGQTKAPGMAGMLTALGLPLVGHHHLGIDDSRNIAAIVCELRRRGAAVVATAGPRAAAAGGE